MNKYLDIGYQYKDIFFIIKKSSPYRIEELTRGYMNFKAKSFKERSHSFIIAEIGVNHNGDVGLAKELIYEAKKAGADCVKFQTFKSSNVVSQSTEKAKYQKLSTGSEQKQLEMLMKLELTYHQFAELFEECERLGIEFASTPYNTEDIVFLDKLGVSFFKSSSMHLVETDFLRKLANTKKPLVISTGMATLREVENAVNIIREAGNSNFTLLQCTTNYPTHISEVNLLSMVTMGKKFSCPIGYSDHTKSEIACLGAIALGAKIIEKHFTLDKNMAGPDHFASCNPDELTSLIKKIRDMEFALGNKKKQPTNSESENMNEMRRSISSFKDIKAGEIISEKNIICRRPATGIAPKHWDSILGKTVRKDIPEGTFLSWEDIID